MIVDVMLLFAYLFLLSIGVWVINNIMHCTDI